MKYVHSPVLLTEVLTLLIRETDTSFLDCTLGEGGHTEAVLIENTKVQATGLDRDEMILNVAKERLSRFGNRFSGYNINFTDLNDISLPKEGFDCALIDLGISVFHYKNSGRGFTFLNGEPLDMRLDQSGVSAADIVNSYSEYELRKMFYTYAEERFAPQIARQIVAKRKEKPFTTVDELADLIKNAIPNRFHSKRIHPATKVFQALRICVNNEFENIEKGIPIVLSALKKGGRLGVITFHSLEDRIVKKIFAHMALACVCPPKIPECRCDKIKEVSLCGKSVAPSDSEIFKNPPSRSARLRIVEKV